MRRYKIRMLYLYLISNGFIAWSKRSTEKCTKPDESIWMKENREKEMIENDLRWPPY